jgi:hypothetical protein
MKVSIVSKFTNIIKMTPDDVIIPKIFHCPKNSKIREFICLYFNMSKLIFITGFVILFLYIFLYGVMRGHGFDSHKFQYSWKYSGAYFYGLLPAVVIIFSSWVIFSMLMFYSRNLKLKRTTEFKYNNFNKSFRILSIVYTINIIVSVLADYFYVYTESSKGYSNTTKVLLQIFFSIWHVFWNLVAIPAILRILKSSPGIQFKGRLGCRLFNLIIASSVATMLADPLCYHYLLFSPPMTQYSYVIPKCIASTYSYGVITCTEEGFLGPYLTEFTPPFIYSRICYSAILTNYAPIIIYTSIFQLIFFPFIYIFPAKLLKKGKYALGLPQMLWPPDPDWSPPYYSSYLKIPKMLSSVFYYLALLLSFGILAPAVVVPVLLAFMSEIITFSYFLRRFLFMIVKYQDPSVKEIKVPIIEVLSIDTENNDDCDFAPQNYDWRPEKISNDINKKNYQDVLEEECADKNFSLIRPIVFITICTSFFLSCVALDMSSVDHGAWAWNIYFIPLSIIIPFLGVVYLYYHKKYDLLKILSERTYSTYPITNPINLESIKDRNGEEENASIELREIHRNEIRDSNSCSVDSQLHHVR